MSVKKASFDHRERSGEGGGEGEAEGGRKPKRKECQSDIGNCPSCQVSVTRKAVTKVWEGKKPLTG